jgi:hypothetical protein
VCNTSKEWFWIVASNGVVGGQRPTHIANYERFEICLFSNGTNVTNTNIGYVP